jgi:ORF6N domain
MLQLWGLVRHSIGMSQDSEASAATDIVRHIYVFRGHRVLLDSDLAALYGVATKRLNEQVRRNIGRFPEDFILNLTDQEVANLRSQFATSSLPADRWGGRRYQPMAFTEHGAIMAATVLNSPRAVQMTVYVVRAFVRTRELLASHTELARELAALKKSVASLDASTRIQFDQVYEAILGLMSPAVRRQ